MSQTGQWWALGGEFNWQLKGIVGDSTDKNVPMTIAKARFHDSRKRSRSSIRSDFNQFIQVKVDIEGKISQRNDAKIPTIRKGSMPERQNIEDLNQVTNRQNYSHGRNRNLKATGVTTEITKL